MLESNYFNRRLSEYILGEVKNYMNFYISNNDYQKYIKFFDYLNGVGKFSWDEYLTVYDNFCKYMNENEVVNTQFYKTPLTLLQFFYDANLISSLFMRY